MDTRAFDVASNANVTIDNLTAGLEDRMQTTVLRIAAVTRGQLNFRAHGCLPPFVSRVRFVCSFRISESEDVTPGAEKASPLTKNP